MAADVSREASFQPSRFGTEKQPLFRRVSDSKTQLFGVFTGESGLQDGLVCGDDWYPRENREVCGAQVLPVNPVVLAPRLPRPVGRWHRQVNLGWKHVT